MISFTLMLLKRIDWWSIPSSNFSILWNGYNSNIEGQNYFKFLQWNAVQYWMHFIHDHSVYTVLKECNMVDDNTEHTETSEYQRSAIYT